MSKLCAISTTEIPVRIEEWMLGEMWINTRPITRVHNQQRSVPTYQDQGDAPQTLIETTPNIMYSAVLWLTSDNEQQILDRCREQSVTSVIVVYSLVDNIFIKSQSSVLDEASIVTLMLISHAFHIHPQLNLTREDWSIGIETR